MVYASCGRIQRKWFFQKAVCFLVALTFLVSFTLPVSQAVAAPTDNYYVDANAAAGGDGLTQATAFQNLTQLFAVVGTGAGYSGTVYIASGDYALPTPSSTDTGKSACKLLGSTSGCKLTFVGAGASTGANGGTRIYSTASTSVLGSTPYLFCINAGSAVSFKGILFDGGTSLTATSGRAEAFDLVNDYTATSPISFTDCAAQNFSGMFVNLNNASVLIDGLTINTKMPTVVDAARSTFNATNTVTVQGSGITLASAAAGTAYAARSATEVTQGVSKDFTLTNLTNSYYYQIPLSSGTRALTYVPNLPLNSSGGSATTLSLYNASASGTTINLTPRIAVSSAYTTVSSLVSRTTAHAIIATDPMLAFGDVLAPGDAARAHVTGNTISQDPATPTNIGLIGTVASGYSLGAATTGANMTNLSSFTWDSSYPNTLYLALVDGPNGPDETGDAYGGNVYAVLPITRVHFDANTGSGAMDDGVAAVDSQYNLPANTFTNGDRAFVGWNTEANGGGTAYADLSIASVPYDGMTLYAQWATHVTYNGNGNTAGDAATDATDYAQGDPVTVLGQGTLVKDGYKFLGWSTDDAATTADYVEGDTFDMQSGNVTLYAVWQPIPTFNILYDGNDATSGTVPIDPSGYPEGSPATVLFNTGDLEKTGYDFLGWSTDPAATTAEYQGGDTLTMTGADTTLYAVWQEEAIPPAPTFTATFTLWDGNVFSQAGLATGSLLSKPADPTRTGYTFGGWYKDEACTEPWDFANDTVTGDVTLYAQWTPVTPAPPVTPLPVTPEPPATPLPVTPPAAVTFDVTFDSQGGSSVAAQKYSEGELVTKPADPTRTGYTFGGWYKDEACTEPWDFANDTVTGDVTLYAQWTPVKPAKIVTSSSATLLLPTGDATTISLISVLVLLIGASVVYALFSDRHRDKA